MTDTPLPRLDSVTPWLGALGRHRREVGLVWLASLLAGALVVNVAPLGPGTAAAAVAGIAMPLLLRFGRLLWPGVWLAGFSLALIGERSFLAALFLASFAAVLGASAAGALRHLHVSGRFERKRDVGIYLLVAFATAALAALATFGAATFDEGFAARPALGLRALAAGALGALVFGVALLAWKRSFGAALWRARRIALPLAAAALAGGALAPLLPAEGATLAAWGVGALLCALAWQAGALPAALAASAALLLRLAVERFGLPQPVDDRLWHEALELFSTAALWGAAPLFVAAWCAEAAGRERRWDRTLQAAEVAALSLDTRHRRLVLSRGWLALLGLAELPGEPDAFWAIVHPDDLQALRDLLLPAPRRDGAAAPLVARLRHGALDWRRIRITCLEVQYDLRGRAIACQAIAQDVTDADSAHDRARVAERVYDQLGEGLLVTDAQGRVVRANARYAEITGERPEALVGSVPRLLRSALTSVAAAESDSQLRRLGSWQGEVVDRRSNGELCTLALSVSQVRDEAGSVTHHTVLVSDLTQAREDREQLERKALTDELTQLPNRVHLVQLLEAAMQAADRHGNLLSVISIDLDHFKAVNDRLGAAAGDKLLVQLTQRLDAALREVGDEVLARVGGDEFVLLMRAVDMNGSRQAVQRVLDTIALPFSLGEPGDGVVEQVALAASIGATVYPKDRSDAETLLRHAGHALWGVKQAGRNAFQFFDAERHRQAEARFSALGRLQEAFDADEFCLHFQPKVDMKRGKVLGAEALLRWTHPEQGIVPPGQFLPLIENTPLAVDLGTWVLRKGVEQLAHWHRQGVDMTLSVNVSARLLQEPMFGKYVAGLLQRHRAPLGRKLILEVLETAALKDMERTRKLMDECHELGVRFALDDFGTGFSNLTYLRQLPVDMLKIDRSFVANMLNDKEDLAIVEGVLALARTFGCSVVAEGVETGEQARRLIRMGCHIGQGYGIAKPMPVDQLLAWADGYKGIEGVPLEQAAVTA